MTSTATLMDDLTDDRRSLQIFAQRRVATKDGARLLLIIDQFEELFVLCHTEEERVAFIDNLLTAASETAGPVILVVILRADFYAYCANYVQLREALAQSQEYIGTMSNEELQRAIEAKNLIHFHFGLVHCQAHSMFLAMPMCRLILLLQFGHRIASIC